MTDVPVTSVKSTIAKLPLLAALIALVGLADSIYLTIHHYNAEPVPCGAGFDCEMVLTSPYSTLSGFIGNAGGLGDLPLSIPGAAAYFLAFSLAILAAFGDSRMWKLFGVHITLMAVFAGYLIYLQAVVIHAFCQYCLLSAATTFTLFIIYLISIFVRRRTV